MTSEPRVEPRVLPRSEHSLSRKNLQPNALKVLYRLSRAGFKAYLVGGSVRDLLLGQEPKDYDVATDARPQQIRRLFRNSRIIGRRFRLAHIFFREGIIEVATFRRDPDPQAQATPSGELLITDDNVFGTPEQDAFRRDFTINALFYDIASFSVIDYVGGIPDLEERRIRVIGEPDIRFQEDPVRMLRACEFAGRLGFTIEQAAQGSIYEHRREIAKAAPARLTEEVLGLLRSGHAGASLQWMLELGLIDELLPEVRAMLRHDGTGPGDFSGMIGALDRIAVSKELSETALFATMLLPEVLRRRHAREAESGRTLDRARLARLTGEAIAPFFARLNLSQARADRVARAILDFHRLGEERWSLQRKARFTRSPGFDDALALLENLVEATGEGGDTLAEWKRIAARRPKPSKPSDRPRGRRRGRPRRRRRTRGRS